MVPLPLWWRHNTPTMCRKCSKCCYYSQSSKHLWQSSVSILYTWLRDKKELTQGHKPNMWLRMDSDPHEYKTGAHATLQHCRSIPRDTLPEYFTCCWGFPVIPRNFRTAASNELETSCPKESREGIQATLGKGNRVIEKRRRWWEQLALSTDGHTSLSHPHNYILLELNEAGRGYHLSAGQQEKSWPLEGR